MTFGRGPRIVNRRVRVGVEKVYMLQLQREISLRPQSKTEWNYRGVICLHRSVKFRQSGRSRDIVEY